MRPLTVAAVLTIGLHACGLVLAVVAMRPGTALVPLDDRMAYLASRPLGWALAWGVWMLAALATVLLMGALRSRASRSELATSAFVLAAAGAALDLSFDVGQIAVLPDVAAWKPPQPALFVAWERFLGAGGAVASNALYASAILLMTLALRRDVPAYATALGVAAFGAGGLMIVAGFRGDAGLLEISVGPTIGSYLLWSAVLAWRLGESRRER